MSNIHFRGLSGVIRRGIHSGALKGEITVDTIRPLLTHKFVSASDNTITNSLKYLVGGNEIVLVDGKYYTKESKLQTDRVERIVTGYITNTKTVHGKILVTIEATSIDIL